MLDVSSPCCLLSKTRAIHPSMRECGPDVGETQKEGGGGEGWVRRVCIWGGGLGFVRRSGWN